MEYPGAALSARRHRAGHGSSQVIGRNQFEGEIIALQDDLSLLLEIDRDAAADDRLDLPEAPARLGPVAHDGANLEERVLHGPI